MEDDSLKRVYATLEEVNARGDRMTGHFDPWATKAELDRRNAKDKEIEDSKKRSAMKVRTLPRDSLAFKLDPPSLEGSPVLARRVSPTPTPKAR
jgi:hypothetical protein